MSKINNNSIPRPEYPRPQLVRDEWINLNGIWEFQMDFGRSGRDRRLYEANKLEKEILVPFCPESKLSGIEYIDFMPAVWYRREFTIPKDWRGKRVILHFGAVDYECEVWINGVSVGSHKGGYSSFSFDITSFVKEGTNVVTLCAEDDMRSGLQPVGKQRTEHHFIMAGCSYTRTTGIWQTVWLECVPDEYIESIKMIPDAINGNFYIEGLLKGNTDDFIFEIKALYNGKPVGGAITTTLGNYASATVSLSEIYLWEPGNPNLYDLEISIKKNNTIIDKVTSYIGLRSVYIHDGAIMLNGKPVFQRLVLDQGYYPDGIYTAPTDEDLRRDIEISMGLGFNGARLHQKVFEPRFLYHADKMGYLVWGEHANWGLNLNLPQALGQFLPEWVEILKRDFNHPSILVWCPFNETITGGQNLKNILTTVYHVTKAMDHSRPVIDTSGFIHTITDIYDIHDYDQDPESFAKKFEPLKTGGRLVEKFEEYQKHEGQPVFVSEYGGIWWNPDDNKGWGYGKRPASEEEFIHRYRELTGILLSNPKICGFCYTQLYDVEQEVNGLYTYSRKPKFDPAVIRKINTQKAAIEE